MNFLLFFIFSVISAEDFYSKLNISKDATTREIRQAFRTKVLVMHPDKNLDDPDAEDKFIKLRHAYDVLKDENLRKKYDLYGEKGLDKQYQKTSFHSWNYYHDNFGIYDNDYPYIITINKDDFEQSVVGSVVWFVNYYHPMCSHCHTLAPLWREIAKELNGILRFGAVNCDDDYELCNMERISGFPKLILYPEGKIFTGHKSKETLLSFVLKYLDKNNHYNLENNSWKRIINYCHKPWVVVSHSVNSSNYDHRQLKISAIFGEILCIAEINCDENQKLCQTIGIDYHYKYFSSHFSLLDGEGTEIEAVDTLEIINKLWSVIPELSEITKETLQDTIEELKNENRSTHLLCIFFEDDLQNEMKKLPHLVPNVDVAKVKCSHIKNMCDELFISKIPAFILFKPLGGYEMHQGRQLVDDVATFVWEGVKSPNYQILTPNEFPDVLKDGKMWFIDFYSPNCPPCLKMLPQFKKASRLVETNVNFGSIDCISHKLTCNQYNIRQYPTTILYNGSSTTYEYFGSFSANNIAQFVEETIHSLVINLDDESFRDNIVRKQMEELWVVDYFANWCEPCRDMAHEYKKLARSFQNMKEIKVASIDCAVYHRVCEEQGIINYPTIRLYPIQSFGTSSRLDYMGPRKVEYFRKWVVKQLPSVVKLLDDQSFESVLRSSDTWLVYFYIDGCPPCHQFEPKFEEIAQKVSKTTKTGKINCMEYHWICRSAGVNAYPAIKIYWGVSTGRQNVRDGSTLSSLDVDEVVSFINANIKTNQPVHDEF